MGEEVIDPFSIIIISYLSAGMAYSPVASSHDIDNAIWFTLLESDWSITDRLTTSDGQQEFQIKTLLQKILHLHLQMLK